MEQVEGLVGGLSELPLEWSWGVLEIVDLNDSVDAIGTEVQLPYALLQELNPPSEEVLPLLLIREGVLIQFLVQEFSVCVVAHWVAFFSGSLHEHHALQVGSEVISQKSFDSKAFSP